MKARELHRSAIVIDAEDVSLQDREHLEHMQRAGVTAAAVTVACFGDFVETCRAIAEMNVLLESCGDIARLIRTGADIAEAKTSGRVGVIYAFQNSTPIQGDLRFIRLFADLGVRVFQPVWDAANLVGDSGYESRGGGLTRFGRATVQEICRQHMVLDLSHCDHRTTMDAIEVVSGPVAFTHANAYNLCASPRNKTDEAIKAMAQSGGVMGLTPLGVFVSDDRGQLSLEKYCQHIDYVASLVGVDHVGVGTDFTTRAPRSAMMPIAWGGAELSADEVSRGEYPYPYSPGFETADEFPGLTDALLRRGYREADVLAILGGNWVKLFSRTWTDEG